MPLALPPRPDRASLPPVYDSTVDGPPYFLVIDRSTSEDSEVAQMGEPFFTRTIVVGRRELTRALLAGELRIGIGTGALGDVAEAVRELDAAYMGPAREREVAKEVETANTTRPDIPAAPAAPKLPARIDRVVRDAADAYDKRQGEPWKVSGLLEAITTALGAAALTPDELAYRLHCAADAAGRIEVGGGEPLTDALWDTIEIDGQMPDPRALAALAYRTIAAEIEAGRL